MHCLLQTNLYKLAKEIAREQQIEEVGGYEPQIRDRHRWDVNESIPGEQLRPGALKMQLRPDEEAALPLVCSPVLPPSHVTLRLLAVLSQEFYLATMKSPLVAV